MSTVKPTLVNQPDWGLKMWPRGGRSKGRAMHTKSNRVTAFWRSRDVDKELFVPQWMNKSSNGLQGIALVLLSGALVLDLTRLEIRWCMSALTRFDSPRPAYMCPMAALEFFSMHGGRDHLAPRTGSRWWFHFAKYPLAEKEHLWCHRTVETWTADDCKYHESKQQENVETEVRLDETILTGRI